MVYEKSSSKHTALSSSTRPSKELMGFIEKFEEFSPSRTTILDFGAGNGRHSNALRSLGYVVYSYDPFNGKADADPYSEVSSILPNNPFDFVFSAFVLNVMSYEDMLDALKKMEVLTADDGFTAHIVREDMRKLKGGEKLGKGGSIQRDIPPTQMSSLGYERVGKVFVKAHT